MIVMTDLPEMVQYSSMKQLPALLKKARLAKGYTQEAIALLLHDLPNNYNAVERGRRPISNKKLSVLADALDLDLKELLFLKEQDKQAVEQQTAESDEPREFETLGKPSHFVPFPLKGLVAAGNLEWMEEPEDAVYFQWTDPNLVSGDMFCLKICGHSMAPDFQDGGILLVRETKHFRNGGYYVVQTNENKSTFKMLQVDTSGTTLIPVNKKHKPIPVKGFEITKVYEVLEYKKSFI